MEELLGIVGLGRDPRAFAQLENRFVRRREVATSAGDEKALLPAERGKRRGQSILDGTRQPRDVLPVQRRDRRHRRRVARGMAPALLDLRSGDDHLVAELGNRAVGFPGHEPTRSAPRASRLERERRLALVRDEHEHIGRAVRVQG